MHTQALIKLCDCAIHTTQHLSDDCVYTAQHAGCNGASTKLTRWAELVSRLVIKLVEFVIKYFCCCCLVILQYYANIYRGTILPNTAQPYQTPHLLFILFINLCSFYSRAAFISLSQSLRWRRREQSSIECLLDRQENLLVVADWFTSLFWVCFVSSRQVFTCARATQVCHAHCGYYSRAAFIPFSTRGGAATVREWLLIESGVWLSRYGIYQSWHVQWPTTVHIHYHMAHTLQTHTHEFNDWYLYYHTMWSDS